VEKDKIFSCASIEVLEIPTFSGHLMFMYCDNITKFVSCWVQHVIACVATMVVQMHGFTNEKYELLSVNDTNQNFVERVFFFLQASSRLVFYKCTCYIFLKNIFSTIYDEVKLILTSSSIIIILVPNKESQADLELHKALTTRTSFRTNL